MFVDASRLILAAFLLLIEAAVAFAGRPLTIDDVAPVATGQLEIELGIYHGLPNRGERDQRGRSLP